jgi:flagellar basal body rod protein FlgG
MTRKVYKTAQGKAIDLGSLLLQNEAVRAVGNMNVNARGDLIDSGNKVIDRKNRQIQRQHNRQTVAVNTPKATVHTSTRAAKQAQREAAEVDPAEDLLQEIELVQPESSTQLESNTQPESPVVDDATTPQGGLAAAIARSRAIKQELEKTPRQRAQEAGLKKI